MAVSRRDLSLALRRASPGVGIRVVGPAQSSRAPIAIYDDAAPTAAVELRGSLAVVRNTTTGVDSLVVCLKNSAGGYEWVTVSQSS